MRKLLPVLALLSASTLAYATPVSGSGGGFSGSATLTTTNNGNGSYTITNISGSGIGGLIAPGGFNGNDNLFYPGNASLVDANGFAFTDTQGNTGFQVDIFASSPGNYDAYLEDSDGFSETIPVTLTSSGSPNLATLRFAAVTPAATVTPEPSSLLLVATGAMGVAGAVRRRRS